MSYLTIFFVLKIFTNLRHCTDINNSKATVFCVVPQSSVWNSMLQKNMKNITDANLAWLLGIF